MTARIRLLLAILLLALAPAVAPLPGNAAAHTAMAAPCDGCRHSCDDATPTACGADCLVHASVPVLLAPQALMAVPVVVSCRAPRPAAGPGAAASWPPPLRPPCS